MEKGVAQTGILMPVDDDEPLTVVMYQNSYTRYSKRILDGDDQLRRDDGAEVCQAFRKQGASSSALQGKKKAMTPQFLKDAVAACIRAKQAACAKQELEVPTQDGGSEDKGTRDR